MPTPATARRLILFFLGVTLTSFPLVTFAQDAKPPLAPAAEPLAPSDAGNAPTPAAPTTPPMRQTKPVVVDLNAPGAPGSPALPKNPGPPNEPLFIPEIPGSGPAPQLPGPDAGPVPTAPTGPTLQRTYTVGKFIVKYGNDVQERNPKLPKEEELAASEVMLLETPDRRLFHIAKAPVAIGAAKSKGGLLSTTTAEQNVEGGRSDEDEALHPPMPVPSTPVVVPAVKLAKKDGAKPAKEDKTTPKAIPKAGTKGVPAKFKVSEFGAPRTISAMALLDVYDAVVKKLTDRGLIGVYILADVNPRKGVDERDKAQGVIDVKVSVFISEVAKIRTIARKIPYKLALPKINDDDAPDGQPVKDPKHLWIKAKSPVFVSNPKKPGGPLEKPRLQNYLSRLNRFPGRRVDAAINATGETGKVMLDYLIREQKNYVIYAQEANNGTPSTGEWRSRIGLELRQLANKDDILRLEYTTTDLQRFNSGILSYQFALVKPDVLKARVYGLYGQFSAEDVGFAGATFTGDSLTAGVAFTWTPLYWHGFPLDITAGGEFMRVTVNNAATGGKSAVNFILPYLAVGTDRSTEKFSLAANVQVKGSFSDKDQDQLNGLGRFDTDGGFFYMNGDVTASIFLEPLLLGKKWGNLGPDGTKWKRGILANELALIVHSQYALGNRRLVPQLELIAGGSSSVRGYPESFTSGDSGFVGSLEYRLHLPRLFKPSSSASSKPASKMAEKKLKGDLADKTAKADKAGAAAGKIAKAGGTAKPGTGAAAPAQPEPVTEVTTEKAGGSPSFRLRPGSPGTGADWDLIARAFLDYGQTYNNRAQAAVEVNRTMMSIGGGLELQMFKLPGKGAIPLYITVRADYGYVLQAQTDLLLKPVEVGDNRIHISATIAW